MATAECWLCFARGQLHPSGMGEAPSPHWDQSCSGVTFPMPWERTEGRADPVDNQVSFCSQTPRLEPITHSMDVTCSCFLLTSVLLVVPHILWRLLPQKPRGEQGIFLTSCWSQPGGREGQEAQDSWFQSRSLPVEAMWFTLPLSWCLPGLIHARCSREGNSQLWDANAQGFSVEVPDPNQGLFSC